MVGFGSALVAILWLLIEWEDFEPSLWENLLDLVPGVCLLLTAVLLFWLAYRLRNLNEKSRKTFFVYGWIGLLFFPVGTIVNGYLLYLLLSAKGKRTLSPEYRQVIAATPHIRYKSPWILGAIILATAIAIPILIVYFAVQGQ